MPSFVEAQNFVPCSGSECSSCHIVQMANKSIVWIIMMLFVIFAVMLFIAGFKLITSGGNSAAKSAAKNKLANVLIGLIIILLSWVLVDTVMRGLLAGGTGDITGFGPWSEVKCDKQSEPVIEGVGDSLANGPVAGWKDQNGNDIVPSLGTGNSAIVSFAQQMDAKNCIYNQSLRNACQGNPGYTDCSDLVNAAYKTAGCSSPGVTTAEMYPKAKPVGQSSSLKAGDALVYRNSNNTGHVVICADDGCSQVIHASGVKTGIKVSNSSYYLQKSGVKAIRTSDYCP